tara:strand:+ start:491 stop:1054 length:564 start_codon:yes stop_codon:yes gene_type:complete
MIIEQTTFPDAINVVSLTVAKSHLRVEHTDDDALITSLITAAQEMVQKYTGTFLQRTAVNFYSDTFMDYMDLHAGPSVTLTAVQYKNTSDVTITVPTTGYQIDGKSYPARLRMTSAPKLIKDELNAVTIQSQSGYETANRPQALISAMLLIIGHLYENRQDVTRFKQYEIPMASQFLMEPYRLKSFR